MKGAKKREYPENDRKVNLPGKLESVHVFHGITLPWKPIAVKFVAPDPNLFGSITQHSGQVNFAEFCRKLASEAAMKQIDHVKLGLKCFSCGNNTVGLCVWNAIQNNGSNMLWLIYGACTCNNPKCLTIVDERVKGWLKSSVPDDAQIHMVRKNYI